MSLALAQDHNFLKRKSLLMVSIQASEQQKFQARKKRKNRASMNVFFRRSVLNSTDFMYLTDSTFR